MAAYLGHAEITRLLLETDADVTAVDPGMKATALHAAAYAGRTEPAKLLIEYGVDVDAQGPYNGYTALHDAIWQNNVDTARVIVEAGADLTYATTRAKRRWKWLRHADASRLSPSSSSSLSAC